MSYEALINKLSKQEVEDFPEKLDAMERLEGVKSIEDLRRRTRFRPLLSIISGLWHAVLHCAFLHQAISTRKGKDVSDAILTTLEGTGEISKRLSQKARTRAFSKRKRIGYAAWRLLEVEIGLLAMANISEPPPAERVNETLYNLEAASINEATNFRPHVRRTLTCLLRLLQGNKSLWSQFKAALRQVAQSIYQSGKTWPQFQQLICIETAFNHMTHSSHIVPYSASIFEQIISGNLEETKRLLLNKEASIFDVDPFGLPVLYYGTMYCANANGLSSAISMFKMLAHLGADVSHPDEVGNTPLEILTEYALIEWAKKTDTASLPVISSMLYKCIAEIKEDHAVSFGFRQTHRILFGIEPSYQSLEDYLGSIDPQSLTGLIDQPDYRGRSALVCAVEYGWFDAVRTLVKFGANVNQQRAGDENDLSLLHLVYAGPQQQVALEIAEFLIEEGAKVDARDSDGWTPLLIALSWNNIDALPALMGAGAELTAVTYDGEDAVSLSGDVRILGKVREIIDVS